MSEHRIPAARCRTEITVVNSRFITSIAPAFSVDEAKAFIAKIRAEMPDAAHHVYAYRIGHGNSVIEGMSDDGEPSGTSGPPTLAVLRGSGLGDTVLVITRYFGGTKLGTGGLVRAYSDAAREGLSAVQTTMKIARQRIGMELAYTHFQPIRTLLAQHEAEVEEETFTENVTIFATLPAAHLEAFQRAATELSAGTIEVLTLD